MQAASRGNSSSLLLLLLLLKDELWKVENVPECARAYYAGK
jgi:hypothetical protein